MKLFFMDYLGRMKFSNNDSCKYQHKKLGRANTEVYLSPKSNIMAGAHGANIHQDAQLASSFIVFFRGLVIVQKSECFQAYQILLLSLLTQIWDTFLQIQRTG